MIRFLLLLGTISLTLGWLGPANSSLISNGDFTNGLSDWKIDNAGGLPSGITRIDIDGPGPLKESNAFFVQTGGGFGSRDVSVSQRIEIIDRGVYTLSANIAASYFPTDLRFFNNLSGGVITAKWNGETVDSFDFGDIAANSWEYGTLNASFTATSLGILEINFFRPFAPNINSPINYLDNISLALKNNFAPVPEPATILLIGTGIIGIAGCGRKRLKQLQEIK